MDYVNKKRVLLVINEPLKKAGNQTLIMSLVKNLSDRYVFDILIFSSILEYYDNEFRSYGGEIYRIPNYEGNNNILKRFDFYFRWIWNRSKVKKILNNNYDVIHCINGYESGYVLKLANKYNNLLRISTTATIKGKVNIIRRVFDYFGLRLINKYANYKIGPSKVACETTFGSCRYFVIPNSCDAKFLIPINKKTFDVPSLIQIGSYSSNKNQLFTIRVFKEIIKEYPNAKLNFIGFEAEKDYFKKMQNLVSELNIVNNVIFNPSNANAICLLDESTHLLLTSIRESFGIVLLEGQARGVKCIAPDHMPKDANAGGIEYLPLNSGEKSWADFIIKDFQKNKGAHFEYDLSRFSEENILQQYDRLYRGEL